MKFERGCCDTTSVISQAQAMSLDPRMLYETVIELASEGLLTARCVNAAAGLLLTQLGLPTYFFENISQSGLKRVLRTVATNIFVREDEEVVLRGEVFEARLDIDGGVQARIATPENRDRMETVLNEIMNGNRVEYYYSPAYQHYTYIIHPCIPPPLASLEPGEFSFAFNQDPTAPRETRRRYESFLGRCERSVVPLVEVSDSPATEETRVMFRDDFCQSALPVIRQMFEPVGITLNRAYWETYRGKTGRVESICSLYLAGRPRSADLETALAHLRSLLALPSGDLDDLCISGTLTFEEYAFATLGYIFAHHFIYKDLAADREILESLPRKNLRDAFARRVFDTNRSEYTRNYILDTLRQQPALIKHLYRIFDRKFNPRHKIRPSERWLKRELEEVRQQAAITFVDDRTGYDIFVFMTRLITDTLKTNFYQREKRSHAFRLAPTVLDPLVFPSVVHGVFLVAGFYALGTHMRAADVSRGGVRLVRSTPQNYENELDNMPLLNYALGPVAQRLKHKDIAESGAKGVIVPRPEFAHDGLHSTMDFADGIMDLMLPGEEVVDLLGQPEMIFFGPDEGTANFMDAVAYRARERGYRYWRTMTTGKSFGIPHDTYGLTHDRQVFGLLSRGEEGTELQLNGRPQLVTTDLQALYEAIGEQVATSGMTTMGVMSSLRTVLAHVGLAEEETRLMMTGGPDGDLGANQIQSFKGRICLIVDGGSVLFDPEGLDRTELVKLALARHTRPRLDSLAFPAEKLSPKGFRIPRAPGQYTLPDGTVVSDGQFFHRTFLTNPQMRAYMAEADIQAFVPCGGFKDTINAENVRAFLNVFQELQVIVEGANVFFDESSREIIARDTHILQIKDSSANKGGVTSSAIAEVLSAFVLGDRYEEVLVENPDTRSQLIRAVFDLIAANATAETKVLLALRQQTGEPLHSLSVRTSLDLFALQDTLYERLPDILALPEVVQRVLEIYVPQVLLPQQGSGKLQTLLNRPELQPYRDAILTKKLAALALYRYAADWAAFRQRLQDDFTGTLRELCQDVPDCCQAPSAGSSPAR